MSYQRIDWKTARLFLSDKSLDSDEEIIAAMVERGEAACYQVGLAALVGRFDGSEFVLMCLEGETSVAALRDFFEAIKRVGARTIRIHTKNPAVARLANIAMRGLCRFSEYERVYKAEIK